MRFFLRTRLWHAVLPVLRTERFLGSEGPKQRGLSGSWSQMSENRLFRTFGALPAQQKTNRLAKWIRRGLRAPPPPGSSSLKPGIVFGISDMDTRARGKIKMPSQFPDIYSNDRLEEVFDALDQQCSSGIAAAISNISNPEIKTRLGVF